VFFASSARHSLTKIAMGKRRSTLWSKRGHAAPSRLISTLSIDRRLIVLGPADDYAVGSVTRFDRDDLPLDGVFADYEGEFMFYLVRGPSGFYATTTDSLATGLSVISRCCDNRSPTHVPRKDGNGIASGTCSRPARRGPTGPPIS
jgi:hypothetical protein